MAGIDVRPGPQTGVVALFGDQPRSFRLSVDAVARLETRCQSGVGAIFARLASQQFYAADVWETIRFGLLGGGLADDGAMRLVDEVRSRESTVLASYLQLAADILAAHIHGIDQANLAVERLQFDQKKTPGEGDLIPPGPIPATSPAGSGLPAS